MRGLKRREFLRRTGQVGAAGIFTAPLSILLQSCLGLHKPYNILFIAVDDLNDWVGFLDGHPQAMTPNMDRLASESIVFEKAYCASPLCNPSRTALLTGIPAHISGIYDNKSYFRNSPILSETITLPQYLRNHGYFTMARGKIFHRPQGTMADVQSWDRIVAEERDGPNASPPKQKLPLNGIDRDNGKLKRLFDWGPVTASIEEFADFKNARWAASQLQNTYEKAFFLACGIFRPHLPWYVPQKYFDRFPLETIQLPAVREDDLDDIPAAGRKISGGLRESSDYQRIQKSNKTRQAVQSFLASIAFADDCIGEILDGLERSPYRDNTIAILWGDNGWHLAEKLHYRKNTLWEEATRVPLTIRVPGMTQDGMRCSRPVSLQDLYPTIVSLCHLPPRDSIYGQSLVPLLNDPEREWDYPVLSTRGFNNHSIRSDRWRYIRYADGSEELYDRSQDEMEWTNLAGLPNYRTVIDELRRHIPQENARPQSA
jgi:arylsulfatase A-like enzyme